MITKKEFVKRINEAVGGVTDISEKGVDVFWYIDKRYGFANEAILRSHVENLDSEAAINDFINEAYELARKQEIHDFPGENMIDE